MEGGRRSKIRLNIISNTVLDTALKMAAFLVFNIIFKQERSPITPREAGNKAPEIHLFALQNNDGFSFFSCTQKSFSLFTVLLRHHSFRFFFFSCIRYLSVCFVRSFIHFLCLTFTHLVILPFTSIHLLSFSLFFIHLLFSVIFFITYSPSRLFLFSLFHRHLFFFQ